MNPTKLDHVAFWVAERDLISDFVTSHLGMHVIDRTDKFTLLGADEMMPPFMMRVRIGVMPPVVMMASLSVRSSWLPTPVTLRAVVLSTLFPPLASRSMPPVMLVEPA